MLTRGPIHVVELIARNQAETNDRARNPPAVRPKNVFARDQRCTSI